MFKLTVRDRIEANVRRIHENWASEEDIQKLTDSRLRLYHKRQAERSNE